MLLVSNKVIFIEKEAILLCVTRRKLVTRVMRNTHLQLQSSVKLFDMAFAITKSSFCDALFKRIFTLEQGIRNS